MSKLETLVKYKKIIDRAINPIICKNISQKNNWVEIQDYLNENDKKLLIDYINSKGVDVTVSTHEGRLNEPPVFYFELTNHAKDNAISLEEVQKPLGRPIIA